MKITHRKITASTDVPVRIPAPFRDYYDVASDAEVAAYTGCTPKEGEPTPCEAANGYDVKHLGWALAKPEYRDALGDDGIDLVEMITSGWDSNKIQLAYTVGKKIFPVEPRDLTDVQVTASTVTASAITKVPAPFDKYYQIMSDEEVEELTGEPAHPSPCEDCEGYDVKSLCYLAPKKAYEDILFDNGIGDVELLREGNRIFVGYCVHDRVYSVDESELPEMREDVESSTCITAASQIQIPETYSEYYEVLSDNAYEQLTGKPAHPSPCEANNTRKPGHEVDHICYVVAKPEYKQNLDEFGFGILEVMKERNAKDYVDPAGLYKYSPYSGINRVSITDVKQAALRPWDAYQSSSYSDDIDEREEAFGDDPVGGIATMFSISYEDAETIFDWYDAEGATEDFDNVRDFLDFVNDDILNMLDAADDQYFANQIRAALGYDPVELDEDGDIKGCDQVSVNSAVDTGLEYWYYSRHGFGIGTIPKGVQVLDWYEEGYKTWMKLDKMLTTAELNEFDLKEQTPPEGVTTHNGDIIEGCSNINASECKQVSEDDNSIEYVVTDTEINGDNVEACDVSFFDKAAQQIEGQSNEIDTCSTVEGNSSVNKIDIDALKAELNDAIIEYMVSEGFTRPGTPKESKYAVYADDYFVLEVTKDSIDNEDCIKCEVRAELGFDGFMRLTEEFLDPIVKKYDNDSYFDMVDGGIAEAYIVNANRPIEGASDDSAAIDKLRESYLNSEDDAETANVADVTPEDIIIDIPVNTVVNVEEDTAWKLEDASFLEDYVTDDISLDKLAEDFQDVLAWAVPAEAGKYNIKADVTLVYTASPALYEGYSYFLNPKESKVTPSSVEPASKIEESTKIQEGQEVTAASEPMMTEADLNRAILEGKPFDLASFKKYKSKAMSPDILTADKIEAGDIIAVTEDATEVNLGTVVKIISINDPVFAVDWADYTFHVLLMESPEKYWNRGLDPYRNSTLQPGDEMNLHFDADDYVGPLVLE